MLLMNMNVKKVKQSKESYKMRFKMLQRTVLITLMSLFSFNVYAGAAVLVDTLQQQSRDSVTVNWQIYWGVVPSEVCYGDAPEDGSQSQALRYFCASDPSTFTCGVDDGEQPCVADISNTVRGSYTYPAGKFASYADNTVIDVPVSFCTREAGIAATPDPFGQCVGEGETFYTVYKQITLTGDEDVADEPAEEVVQEPGAIASQITATQTSSSGIRNVDGSLDPTNAVNNVKAQYGGYDIDYDVSQSDKKVVAYWGDWSIYGRELDLANIRVENYTHIAYAFMGICNEASLAEIEASSDPSIATFGGNFQRNVCLDKKADGTLAIPDVWAALQKDVNSRQGELDYPGDTEDDITMQNVRGVFEQLNYAKTQRNTDLKVLASIGGWTQSTPFADVAGDATKRQVFIDSVKSFLTKWTLFDGIDIDWEFPQSDEEGVLYVTLIKDIRAALDELEDETGREFELSSAVFTPKTHVDRVDYSEAIQYMDYLFAMNYDYHGAWESDIGFHTNLFGVNDEENSVDFAMRTFLEAGVPKEKLLIGVGAYGRSKQLGSIDDVEITDGVLSGDTTADSYAGPGTWENSVLEWYDQFQYFWAHRPDDQGGIVGTDGTITIDGVDYSAKQTNNYFYLTDPVRNADYLLNPVANTFSDIESPRTAYNKAKYANLNDLAGVFFWVLEYDNGIITNAIHEGLETVQTANPNNVDMAPLIAAFGANTDEASIRQVTGSELSGEQVTLPGVVITRPEGTDKGTFKHVTEELGSSASSVFYVVRDSSIGPVAPKWSGDGWTTLTVPVVDEDDNAEVVYLKALRRRGGSYAHQMNTGVSGGTASRRSRLEVKYFPNDNLHLQTGVRYRTTVDAPLLIDAWNWTDWRMTGDPLHTYTFSLDFTAYADDSDIAVPQESISAEGLTSGVSAEYFSGVDWRQLGTFPERIANVERVEPTIDHPSTSSNWAGLSFNDRFAARYNGYIVVPTSGRYVFTLDSDDGSRMTIGGREIIINDGTHGMRKRSSEVLALEAGELYPMTVEYFEYIYGAGLRLLYQSGETSGQQRIVPSSMLRTETTLQCRIPVSEG